MCCGRSVCISIIVGCSNGASCVDTNRALTATVIAPAARTACAAACQLASRSLPAAPSAQAASTPTARSPVRPAAPPSRRRTLAPPATLPDMGAARRRQLAASQPDRPTAAIIATTIARRKSAPGLAPQRKQRWTTDPAGRFSGPAGNPAAAAAAAATRRKSTPGLAAQWRRHAAITPQSPAEHRPRRVLGISIIAGFSNGASCVDTNRALTATVIAPAARTACAAADQLASPSLSAAPSAQAASMPTARSPLR